MADQFKAGDVVRLKSGGPKMTVTGMDAEKVWVSWFDDVKGEPKHAVFPKATVEIV
jgi:uncharacterized protein YodC (DUF2158 family)